MGRRLRLLDNESGIVELTSRCVHGRHLMRPSSEVNDRILGIIGRAQRLSKIRLYAFTFMSNHFHKLAQGNSVEQLAKFSGFVKGNIARELGRVHDWREKFWGKRYHSACLADDEVDQQRRFFYILSNGCKEGLVDSPLDWPGVSTARALSQGIWTLEGTWLDRSSKRGVVIPVKETVRLSPLPFMEQWTAKEQQQWICDAIRHIEDETRERHRKERTRSVGARRVERQNPHGMAERLESRTAPLFHATSKEARQQLVEARAQKVAAYRDAAARLRRGERDVEFPEDCFPPPRRPTTKKRGPP